MKNFLLLTMSFVALALTISCSGAKKITNPFLGSWDYMVKNTPMGDVGGELIITEVDGKYSGMMLSDQGRLDMSNLVFEGNKLTSDLFLESAELKFEATIEGSQFSGMIFSEFGDFSVTGTKKQ